MAWYKKRNRCIRQGSNHKNAGGHARGLERDGNKKSDRERRQYRPEFDLPASGRHQYLFFKHHSRGHRHRHERTGKRRYGTSDAHCQRSFDACQHFKQHSHFAIFLFRCHFAERIVYGIRNFCGWFGDNRHRPTFQSRSFRYYLQQSGRRGYDSRSRI